MRSSGINGYPTTSINDKIVPEKVDLLDLGVKFGLGRREAEREYTRIEEIILWRKILKKRIKKGGMSYFFDY